MTVLLAMIFATLMLILILMIVGRETFLWVLVISFIAGALIWKPENKNAVITLAVLTGAVMTLRKIHQWRNRRL